MTLYERLICDQNISFKDFLKIDFVGKLLSKIGSLLWLLQTSMGNMHPFGIYDAVNKYLLQSINKQLVCACLRGQAGLA